MSVVVLVLVAVVVKVDVTVPVPVLLGPGGAVNIEAAATKAITMVPIRITATTAEIAGRLFLASRTLPFDGVSTPICP